MAQPVAPPGIDSGVLQEPPVAPRRAVPSTLAADGRRERALPYVPGRLIVKLRGEADRTRVREVAGRVTTAREVVRPSYADFDVVTIDPAADAEEVARRLSDEPEVEYAQASYRVYPYFRPNDPLFSQQWNLSILDMERAWDINQGATSSVVVAVLDTGVAFQNAMYEFTASSWTDGGVRYPALGRVLVPFAAAPELADPNRFVAPYDFIWDDGDPVDTDGHGTHVAGTIGQLTNNGVGVAGMAFNVRIMPVKCISGDWDDIFDSPFVGTDDVVARAIRYAADNGAKVINMSLGRSGGPPATAIGAAMRYAVSRGAFIAVAAGNDFEDGNPIERLAEQAGPIDGAIVVAAVGPDRNRAYYSGSQSYVDIAAPGGNARQPNGLVMQQTYDPRFSDTYLLPPSQYGPPRFDAFVYRQWQGTSMATPHVAGLAALLISQGITSPEAIEAAIERFATDRGATGRDNDYGQGLISPRNTLRGLGLLR
jgi:serine protease